MGARTKIADARLPLCARCASAEFRAVIEIADAAGRIIESRPVTIPLKHRQEALLDPQAFAAAYEHIRLLLGEYEEDATVTAAGIQT